MKKRIAGIDVARVAHVSIGVGLIEEFGTKKLGEYSVCYALVFSICCILFAVTLMKYIKSGPLEWIIRKITD